MNMKRQKKKIFVRNNNLNAQGFPGGSVVNILPANAGDMGSIPDLGRPYMLRGT